jgi:uncharacterized Zn-binding protein involved in type VI secretion
MAVDQPVARIGDPTTTGHGCDGTTTVIGPTGATAKVYANNLGIECKDNPTAAHTIPSGSGCVNHPAKINEGSDSVFIANIPVARVTDSTDGGAITSGSPNVFVGKAPGTFGISSVSVSIYIPEGDQTSAVTLVNNYVAAQTGQPNTYYKPEAVADGVKGNYAGTPEVADPTTVSTGTVASDPTASDLIPFLQARVLEAGSGTWRETGQGGNASNTKITGIWTNLGYPASNPWTTDQTAWCMGFVNYALKNSGYKYVQTASAALITSNPEKWGAVQVPKAEAQPGDIAFWSYRHVNFVYTSANGKYSFVGGNQTPSGGKNNPDDGDITISYPGGTAASNANWVSCWRIKKS